MSYPYPGVVVVLFTLVGCSGSEGMHGLPDGAAAGGASATNPSPDAFLPGSEVDLAGIGPGGAISFGGSGEGAGWGGAGGHSTVALIPDAAVASGGTGGITSRSSQPVDARPNDAPLRPNDTSSRSEDASLRSMDALLSVEGGRSGDTQPSGPCHEAPCLATLYGTCQPEGACTTESDTMTGIGKTNYCFLNGVKEQISIDAVFDNYTIMLAVKRDSATCYTVEVQMNSLATTARYIFRDANGQQVATGIYSMTTESMTVTCEGGSPALLGEECMNAPGTGDGECTTGKCEY